MDPIHAALLQYLTRLSWQWPVQDDPGEHVPDENDETI